VITRRDALRGAAVTGAGLAGLGSLDALISQAVAGSPHHGKLSDIEHVVILMQENRSFDSYFGVYNGVRGFGDRRGRSHFFQTGRDGKVVHPFHFTTGCMADITHDWGPQHQAWNGGRMNRFLSVHERVDRKPLSGGETLGYYTGADIPLCYALARNFTLCDAYHCSVIGPTDPNRVMSMTGTIDPAGAHGGPILSTALLPPDRTAKFSWTTMPERLSAHGVSWKVYTSPAGGVEDNVLTYFKQFRPGSKLYDRGIAPTYPADFLADLDAGKLPKVSWVLLGLNDTEHPDFSSPSEGEAAARQVIEAIMSRQSVWRKTALFMTWDENGGFFDHVAPPVAPKRTKGEYLTVAKLPEHAQGIRGPVGLGFRVPMLVISPFSRGGLVSSHTFDHTSTLRFIETRFGVKVPNLSAWRRRTTGDLTAAFNFAARPNSSKPRLPKPSGGSCSQSPPVAPRSGPFPKQAKGRRRRPSGIVKG
jgi:phospholipase C